MKKSIDKIIILCGDKVVTVTIQMYLKRTTDPESTLVAYDTKTKEYICNFKGKRLKAKRYILYESGSEYFSPETLEIAPFVEELNRKKIVPDDRVIMEIENKMFNHWYDDYAMQNHYLPLREIHRLVKEGKDAEW